MAGNFSLKKISDIDLNDPFFDSLKADDPVGGKVKPFEVWFPEKLRKAVQLWYSTMKMALVPLCV